MKRKRSSRTKPGSDVRPNLRRALWLTYGGKCAYTGEELPQNAFHVDHVVPKELAGPGRHREKLKVLRELGLPEDFDIFALTNLVPTTFEFNREKSNRINPDVIALGLRQAAEKEQAVQELYEHLEAVEGLAEESRDLGERYGGRLDQQFVAEMTYNVISGEPVRFEPIEELGEGHAVVATPRVYSFCFAPVFPDYSGSLLLRFKRVDIYGCGITFGQRDLVGLLRGMGTPAGAGSRPFIVGRDPGDGEYVIQLGNNRFSLSAGDVADLCGVVDRLGAWYLEKLRRAEVEVLRSAAFERAEAGGYLLCGVSLDLWRDVVRFAAAHDFAKGKTPWHVFDADPHYLKIFRRSEGDRHDDYRTFIRPEMDTTIPPAGGPRVWLRWDHSFLRQLSRGEASFKFGTVWDVAETHRWVTEELIPEVVRWVHAEEVSSLSFAGRAIYRLLVGGGPPPVPRAEMSEGADLIDAGRVRRLEDFELVVEKLWSRATGSREAVPPDAGDGAHLFLSLLLDNCDPITDYLLERTAGAFKSSPSVAGIKAAVDRRRQEYLAQGFVSGWEVKSALDAITLLLREDNLRCSPERALVAGLERMAALIERHNNAVYIDRFSAKY